MDARTISNRDLARQLGVSETAVRRAAKAGRIQRERDGSWDLAKVQAAWSDNTDQAQQRLPRQRSDRPRRAALKPVPEAALGAVRIPCASMATGTDDHVLLAELVSTLLGNTRGATCSS
jgi:hypothetical protein